MNKKKITTKDKVLLIVLASLMVIVVGIGAFLIIKNTIAANEETTNITVNVSGKTSSPSSKTYSPDNNNNNSDSDKAISGRDGSKNSSSSNASSTASDSKASSNTSSKQSSSSKTSSKKSSGSAVKGDKVPRVKPKNHSSHATRNELKVNGKTCYVGDTITVVMNITSNKSIVNYQGTMSFNESYLKVKDVKSNDFGIANADGNKILYNASAINGMNFSETGTVFTATFEVLKAGSTKLDNNLEIISELIDNNIKQLSPSDYKATLEVYD